MIEIVVAVLAAAGAGWLLRRKHLARTASGPVPGIPGMARRPAGAGRWRPGRVYADEGGARWVPQRGEPLPLPGARATGVRVPSVKEGMSINPGSRIVTCVYGAGDGIEIAVMALDLREFLEAVPQAEAGTEP
ncbi:hypothetical protein ACFWUQ_30905 [Streptomyces sp. NPDC058662]|uniref:hypothetical protein n=1 Tax=Streptomyces sp. NPDC058662 TaxID=3346583 RepID=UPI0036586322